MDPIITYNVIPKLPFALEPLRELAYNIWWSWEPRARKLFRDLDVELWDRTNHNPVRVLQLSRQSRLIEVSMDEHYLTNLREVMERFHAYLNRKDTYASTKQNSPVAYFSAEYGLAESFPNYSGGLGILSGDHCKSASDLGLNFTAVGLLYRDGYFTQQINKDGWQEAVKVDQNFHHLPIREATFDNEPLKVQVELPGRIVTAKVWEATVGRIRILLLDTAIPENSLEDQPITGALYGGGHELRVQQEIVLGIGGARALKALGIVPDVFHMNEGHAAFLSLERIRELVRTQGLDFNTAQQTVAASNVFTTHTPVPAGNDAFDEQLMKTYFGSYPKEMGITWSQFMELGQMTVDPEPVFSMTILALRTSRFANGVSKLHGEVSQGLWQGVWKDVPVNEIPITSITNGVHVKSWAAGEFHDLYAKYIGADWEDHMDDPDFWRGVIDIPDEVLWNLHQTLKQRTIEFFRERVKKQRLRNGESPEEVRHVNRILNSDVLTVGFARRFATYKRGALLFCDPERLLKLVTNPERPIQFVFAGKAHPADDGGKKIIQQVYEFSRDPRFENRIVFVENYDINVGRRLYHGCDLWLNNPLRPLEASGTSGMKLPPNGGLNLSVLDGWWPESYNGKNGWAIGADLANDPIVHPSDALQNEVDITSLFNVIENQIVPLYYAKPDGRLPLAWIQLMRESIRTVVPVFNTHRMVSEYSRRLYEPAAAAHRRMDADNYKNARALSTWKQRIKELWSGIKVLNYHLEYSADGQPEFLVGETVTAEAQVHLGNVKPEYVRVQAYFGPVDHGLITGATVQDLKDLKDDGNGNYTYTGRIPASDSGTFGINIRVIPHHPDLVQDHELRLITWAR